jgi:uncharacterized protein (TIGR03435 family)
LFPVSRRGGNIPVETMSEPDDQLIAEFNARRSEEAFAALVRQHVNLVFATALRQVGDAGAAEEITQNVFVALAQAAGKLGSHPTIAGWLHQTALNKSREWLRSELRRRRREQVAVNLDLARAEGDSVWSSLVPLLDEALLELREPDRLAVILHFMEGRTFHEVGSALGIGEDTARKRVNRCLEQLAHFFRRRGFAAPALVAGAPLFTLSSHAAPAGLAASATTAGLAAAHSSTSTLTLIKGALKIMAWTKAKTAIVVGASVLLAAGTATVTVKEIVAHRTPAWQEKFDLSLLDGLPPQVKILPSLPSTVHNRAGERNGKVLAVGQSFMALLETAYQVVQSRLIVNAPIPEGKYDFIITYPRMNDNLKALQEEIKKTFGVTVRREMIETNVLILTVQSPNVPGLKPSTGNFSNHVEPDSYSIHGATLFTLTADLENSLGTVIIDETKLRGKFDIDFKWDSTPAGLKRVLRNELGLELTPARKTIEFIVAEKAN